MALVLLILNAMEREKILTTLNGKLGNTSLSDKTIGDFVDNFMPNDGSDPTDADFDKAANILKSLQGQYNHDVATQISKFKKSLPEENIKEPVENAKTGEDKINRNDELFNMIKAIKEQNEQLRQRLDDQDKEKAQYELMTKVKEAMRAKGANDEYVLRNTMKGVILDGNESIDKLVDDNLKRYDKELRDARGDGAIPRQSRSGQNAKTAADAYFARKAKKEGWAK